MVLRGLKGGDGDVSGGWFVRGGAAGSLLTGGSQGEPLAWQIAARRERIALTHTDACDLVVSYIRLCAKDSGLLRDIRHGGNPLQVLN
jgi:hypothetical protein